MIQLPLRMVCVIALSATVAVTTGCGPILRNKSFGEAKKYFVETPLSEHTPDKGAAASWHLIKDPDASSPMLLDHLDDEDMVSAGVSLVLLQAIAGQRYNTELKAALTSRDWSQAPGNLYDYIKIIEPEIMENRPGVVEAKPPGSGR